MEKEEAQEAADQRGLLACMKLIISSPLSFVLIQLLITVPQVHLQKELATNFLQIDLIDLNIWAAFDL